MASLPCAGNGSIDLCTHPCNPPGQESCVDLIQSNLPGSISAVLATPTDYLKCISCSDYPRMRVYQCSDGHIVCSKCIVMSTRCRCCSWDYGVEKIRSLTAEIALDDMTYSCSYRNNGCLTTNIPRNGRTQHEIQCDYNPSPTLIKFCSQFEATPDCQFVICQNSIMQDPEHTKDVIKHLTFPPHNLPSRKIDIGPIATIKIRLQAILNRPTTEPITLFQVCNDTGTTIGYYVLIQRVEMWWEPHVSWAVVEFISASENDNQTRDGHNMLVKLSIKPNLDRNEMSTDGIECIPTQTWTVRSITLKKWKNIMMIPSEQRPRSDFALPVSFLSDFYMRQDRTFGLFMSFGP